MLQFDLKGIKALRAKIGDKEKVLLSDDSLPISDFGIRGKTKIEITLINNLRNILGPHHLEIGENFFVCPSTFFKETSVWTTNPEKWNDGYCFVETGF